MFQLINEDFTKLENEKKKYIHNQTNSPNWVFEYSYYNCIEILEEKNNNKTNTLSLIGENDNVVFLLSC